MKRCSTCGEWKPYRDFYVNPRYRDGYQGTCKFCQQAAKREREAGRSTRATPAPGGYSHAPVGTGPPARDTRLGAVTSPASPAPPHTRRRVALAPTSPTPTRAAPLAAPPPLVRDERPPLPDADADPQGFAAALWAPAESPPTPAINHPPRDSYAMLPAAPGAKRPVYERLPAVHDSPAGAHTTLAVARQAEPPAAEFMREYRSLGVRGDAYGRPVGVAIPTYEAITRTALLYREMGGRAVSALVRAEAATVWPDLRALCRLDRHGLVATEGYRTLQMRLMRRLEGLDRWVRGLAPFAVEGHA